jgi:hypothetical protein
MSKATVAETQRQIIGIEVTQPLNIIIITTRVNTVVAPNMNVGKKGIITEFAVNLSCESDKFSKGTSLNRSSGLPMTNTRVVGTPQMVFTNPIMIIHVHKTIDRPSMNLIVARGYRSTNAKDPKRRH